jgi:hypothetical protein
MTEPTPSPTAPANAASPARRLRELRYSHFPGVRLKQSDVARALADDETVAVSTLSAWENVSKSILPSKDRLAHTLASSPRPVPSSSLRSPRCSRITRVADLSKAGVGTFVASAWCCRAGSRYWPGANGAVDQAASLKSADDGVLELLRIASLPSSPRASRGCTTRTRCRSRSKSTCGLSAWSKTAAGAQTACPTAIHQGPPRTSSPLTRAILLKRDQPDEVVVVAKRRAYATVRSIFSTPPDPCSFGDCG